MDIIRKRITDLSKDHEEPNEAIRQFLLATDSPLGASKRDISSYFETLRGIVDVTAQGQVADDGTISRLHQVLVKILQSIRNDREDREPEASFAEAPTTKDGVIWLLDRIDLRLLRNSKRIVDEERNALEQQHNETRQQRNLAERQRNVAEDSVSRLSVLLRSIKTE